VFKKMSTVGFDLFRCPFCARERTMRKLKTMEAQKYTGWNKSMTCKPDILFDVLWPNCREADIIDYLTGQSKRWLNLHVYVVVFWDYIT